MCLSCRDYAKLHPWQSDTDTSEHFKIFQLLRAYNNGIYTKEDACERLNNIDITDKDTFLDNIKNRINEILSAENELGEVKQSVNTTPRRKRSRKQKLSEHISLNESDKDIEGN